MKDTLYSKPARIARVITVIAILFVCMSCGSETTTLDASLCNSGSAANGDILDSGSSADPGSIGLAGTGPETTDPQLFWNFQLGEFYGGLQVVENGIYVMGGDTYETRAFYHLNAADGSVLTSIDLASGAGTPLYVGEAIIQAFRDGGIARYSASTGKREWSTKVGTDVESSDPQIMYNSTLFVSSGHNMGSIAGIDAVNASNGESLWTFSLKPEENVDNSMVGGSVAVGNGAVFFTTGDGALYAVDMGTGRLCWLHNSHSFLAHPSVAQSGAFLVAGGKLTKFDSHSGTIIWSQKNISLQTQIAESQGTVFAATSDGSMIAIGVRSGDVKWSFEGGDFGSAGIVVSNQTIYAVDASGILFAVDSVSGRQQWSIYVGQTYFRPVVTGGMILIMTTEGLVSVG